MVTFWAALLAAYVLAIASWYLLEKPILGLKRFFEFKNIASTPKFDHPVKINPS